MPVQAGKYSWTGDDDSEEIRVVVPIEDGRENLTRSDSGLPAIFSGVPGLCQIPAPCRISGVPGGLGGRGRFYLGKLEHTWA